MRTKQGIVTSAKMQNTVTVTVHRYVMHPQLRKRFRVSTKFLADTNAMQPREGDEVVIAECRPISKRKKFKVIEILKQAAQVSEVREEELGMSDKGRPTPKKKETSDSPAQS